VNLRRFECDEGSISPQRRVTLYCRDSNSNVFEFVALEKREFLLPLEAAATSRWDRKCEAIASPATF